MNYREETVSIIDIEKNDHFKISRNITSPELVNSIMSSGMLEIPFLIKKNSTYSSLTCHNRISVLADAGIRQVNAYVVDRPSAEIFKRNLVLKVYRNECGPVGRLKAYEILQQDFGINGDELNGFARKYLKLPAEVISDSRFVDGIMNLPVSLKDYIDQKDISFRIVRDIVVSGDDVINEISRWLENTQVRQNIFKMLVDFLFDIKKRDGELKPVEFPGPGKMDDKTLHDIVFRLRYPDYTTKRNEADALISAINSKGVTVEFPEYFERDILSLKFTISKKEKSDRLHELVSSINSEKIESLLKLL